VSLSTVLFLFLAHLGVGIAFMLAFVPRDAGVKFFRFNAGLAAILLVIALAFYLQYARGVAHLPAANRQVDDRRVLAALSSQLPLVVCTALTVFFWATVGRAFTRIRHVLLGVAAIAGVTAVIAQALEISNGASPTIAALTVASFVTSALLLGGACTAMILGHWYLVLPSMDVSYLQRIVDVHISSLVARIVVVAAAVWFAIASWRPEADAGPSFRHYILSIDGIFFWQRVLFGLAGPAVLSYLTRETAKIRSTQSATGILYVDFFTVVVGEVLAKYIVLATRVPV
jgi:protein NrfD